MLHGIPVSPGVVVAPAYCMDDVLGLTEQPLLAVEDVGRELTRFTQACDDIAVELNALIEKVSYEIGTKEAAIFQAHLFMLRDRAFQGKVKSIIVDGHRDALSAVRAALAEYEQLFGSIQDDYLRERLVDLRDVVSRLENHLQSKVLHHDLNFEEPVIVVARELYPSQTVSFGDLHIAGIVTERGGATSHAAIIARSMGIPALSGISEVMDRVKTGDLIALDGREGCIIVNPGAEAESAYRKLQREFFDFKHYLIENRDQAAVTRDGHAVDLLANINNVSDAQAASEVGAVGIGLFRTEYIFLTHPSIPDEEEQYRTYCQILAASPSQSLTIRTLDLGGDKSVPYLGNHSETNPFMGWRSIRLSFEHPDFFRKQIRAILRAGATGHVRMMFPMITTVEELRRVNRMVWQVRGELDREGVPYGKDVKTGIMIEVPAAAICIEHLLPHTSFVSVGTNDLIQYLTAADRDNPKVAHLCDPLSPAVLRVLKHIVDKCVEADKPLTVCGEMAGRPRSALALLSFGLRSLSMSPALVPIVKELLQSVSLGDLDGIAKEVVRRKTARQTRDFLGSVLREVNPRLAMMEFR